MKAMKKSSLAWIALLSINSSNCYSTDESFTSLFMALGKKLMSPLPHSVELISTKAIYLNKGNAMPDSGTQCLYTEIEGQQVCFGNDGPTRIWLKPSKSIKFGLSSQSISQLKYNVALPPMTPSTLPRQALSYPDEDRTTSWNEPEEKGNETASNEKARFKHEEYAPVWLPCPYCDKKVCEEHNYNIWQMTEDK
ncbi:hypothetical protein [Endozoicomonas sp. 4G]|uniref:hypothetical protein n=1 Tax=Endozoicomonas sp. 4G TaxID=2872754 RepID=UPI002078C171|nr:hypothetical protein [Endozoicomonas sp. 4G]